MVCPPVWRVSNGQRHPWHPRRRNRPLQPPANRHRPLPLVAHIPGKPQAPKRLSETPGAPAFPPVLPHKQQHPRPPRLVVDVALPSGGGGGGGALAFPVEQGGAEGQVASRTAGRCGWLRARARLRGGSRGRRRAGCRSRRLLRSSGPLRSRRGCSGRGRAGPRAAGGGGGGAQAIGVVEVEQAGADGVGERLLLGMGIAREPAELAPQAGEAGAQAGQHRLLGDAIEHQPAAGRRRACWTRKQACHGAWEPVSLGLIHGWGHP
jgi:hypothetical protein